MLALQQALQKWLKGARKVAILGVGSELRTDDAVGLVVSKQLQDVCTVYIAETAPENFTGEIKKDNPSHLIIIDAANMGEKPGKAFMLEAERIDGFTSSTHSLPLKIFTDYLAKSLTCKVAIIGIQPASVSFGLELTPEVRDAADNLAHMMKKNIQSV